MPEDALPIELGAILTGGGARRMGGRKADIVVGGVTLVERTWRRIAPWCQATVCVGGGEHLKDHGVPTIPDLFPGADSMGGVATALKHALDSIGPHARVLCVGCDMPLILPGVIELLAARSAGFEAVVPHTGPGFEPLCAVYRASAFPVLERLIIGGRLRMRDVFSIVPTAVIGEEELKVVDPGLVSFVNVNDPSDLAELQRKIRESA